MLILSTYSDLNKPLLTDINEREDYIDFAYEPDTEAFGSCSIKFENRFYVFGGRDEPRQFVVVGGKQIQTSFVQTEICTLGNGDTSILCTGS